MSDIRTQLKARMGALVIQHDSARRNVWLMEGALKEARKKFHTVEAQLNEVRSILKTLDKDADTKPFVKAPVPLPKLKAGTNGKHSG